MLTFIKLLFQLILSPAQGWSDISYAGLPVRRLASCGFYPIIGLAAVTSLLSGVYHPGAHWALLMQEGVVVFVKFFVSYFIAAAAFRSYGHRFSDVASEEKRSQTYILFSLSLLALMDLLQNCIPIDLPVIGFLAIYVAVVMLRGAAYMGVAEDSVGKFMIFSVATVIVPPYLLGFIFNLIIGA